MKASMGESKVRKLVAVVIGVIAGNVVFLLVGVVAERIYPTPPDLMDPQTPEATALRVATAEANGLLLVVLGGALGGFLGSIVGAKVARKGRVPITSAIGGLLSLWAIYSFYVFYPERLWFPVGMLIAFLLFSYLGGLAVAQLQNE